jgi:hypothetical protein
MNPRRRNLFNDCPLCHWCGRLTRLQGKVNGNFATIDHLYSKFHPYRNTSEYIKNHNNETQTVLACWDCNQGRAVSEEKLIPKVKRWERSNQFPKPIRKVRLTIELTKQKIKVPIVRELLINTFKIREYYLIWKFGGFA